MVEFILLPIMCGGENNEKQSTKSIHLKHVITSPRHYHSPDKTRKNVYP